MDLAITLIVVFIVLPAFFLFVFVYIPKSIRSYRLHRVANQFGLEFDNNMSKNNSSFDAYKRNILKGKISDHTIELYDYYVPRIGRYSSYDRRVVLLEDSNQTEIRGVFGVMPSVGKVRRILAKIQNS